VLTSRIHESNPIHNNFSDCLKLLLEFGGSTNNRRDDKFTPLHAAATEGHDECLRLLLEHGAHVNETDQSGRTPLYWSARQGHEECCQLLLEYGARLDIVNFVSTLEDTPRSRTTATILYWSHLTLLLPGV
jgi:ankyrin repeat protein